MTDLDDADTIADYFARGHRALDALLDGALRSADGGDWEAAIAAVADLHKELRRHVKVEELVLLPLLGVTAGVTVEIVGEHRFIERDLWAVADTLTGGDAPAFRAAHRRLREALAAHHAREDASLYPAVDRVPGARARLAAFLRGG